MAQGIFLHDYNTGGKLYDGEITANNKLANRQYVINNAALQSNNLSDLDNAATARTNLGVAIGSDVQAYSARLGELSSLTQSDGSFVVSDGSSFVFESGATARASLGLTIGTDVQAYDAQLADVAGLTPTDGNIIIGDGSNFVTESGATARASLGLAIGSDVQAYDAQLADIAGLTPTDGNIIVGDGSNFVTESGSTARASLGLTIGTDVQAYDAQLADVAGLSPADGSIIIGDGSNFVTENGATARASLGLTIGTDVQAYDAELAALAGLTSAADKLPMFSGSGTATLIDFLDEDDMSSDSATAVPSQQSVKAYVDGVRSGLDIKDSVRAASTGNLAGTYSSVAKTLTLSTETAVSVDGVSLSVGERVLVKDQSTQSENGIYTLTTQGAAGTGTEDYSIASATWYEDSSFSNQAEPSSDQMGQVQFFTDSNFSTQVASQANYVPSSWTFYSDSNFSTAQTSGSTRYAQITFSSTDYGNFPAGRGFNVVGANNNNRYITGASLVFDDNNYKVSITLPASSDTNQLFTATSSTSTFYRPNLIVAATTRHVKGTWSFSTYSTTAAEFAAASFRKGNQTIGIDSATIQSNYYALLTLESDLIVVGSGNYVDFPTQTHEYVLINFASSVSINDIPDESTMEGGKFKIDSSEYTISDAIRVNTSTGSPDVRKYKLTLSSQVNVPTSSVTYAWYNPNGGGTNGVLTRASDFDSSGEITAGAFCFVAEGTTNADAGFVVTTNDDITLDGTGINFTQFSGAGQITAGTGLSKSGNTINATGTLADIAGLNVTDGGIIVGDGSNFILESGSTARASLGVTIGSDVQAHDAILDDLSGLTQAADKGMYFDSSSTAATFDLTAAGRALLDDADAAAQRTTLGLVIGTDVQAQDAELQAIAGLTSAADKGIMFDGSQSAATFDLTAAGRALLDDADASAQRTTMGVAIGSDVQAHSDILDDLAGVTQAADKGVYFDSSSTAATFDLTSAARNLLDDADAAAMRATLGLVIGTDVAAADSSEMSVDVSEPSSIAIGDVDGMYVYDISSGSASVSLPSTATSGCLGKSVIFKIKSTVGTNASLTISPASGQTIDGEASIVLNQERQAIKLVISEEYSSGSSVQCWVVV